MKFNENGIANISAALCKFQGIVTNPKKESVNPHFRSKYANLDEIITTIRPALKDCGLSFIQNPVSDENGNIGVYTILLHESGEYIQFDPVFIPVGKANAHQVGAALTYARRYSLGAALGIATEEDDDANAVQPTTETSGKVQQMSQAKKGTKPTQSARTVAQAQEQAAPEEKAEPERKAAAPDKAELLNGMKQAIENIQEHVSTREEIQADLEQRKKKGRQDVHKMACITKKLTKEESRAIVKAETGKGELKELTLEELKRMYRLFRDTPAAELKETAKAHMIAEEIADEQTQKSA